MTSPGPADPLIVRIGGNGSAALPLRRSVAHVAPGVLHLAVSLQVVDRATGGWLLQRRAASKFLFPGYWANSCCTHPAPGEDPAAAAVRRLAEETGLVVDHVVPAGSFTYRATDAQSGMVEHEHDQVFVALTDTSTARPDSEEIGEIALLPYADALDLVESAAGAPWAPEVLRRSFTTLNGSNPTGR